MKNLIISFLLYFYSTTLYSQEYPKLVVINKDTCFIFNLYQAKKITEWTIMLEEADLNLKLTSEEIKFKDSIISAQSNVISLNNNKEDNYLLIIKKNKEITDIYISKIDLLEKQIIVEKRKKVINRILGIAGTSIIAILYLLK